MKKIILGAMASVAVLAAPASAFAAELVNNGGFETGNFSGWTQGGNTQAYYRSPTLVQIFSFWMPHLLSRISRPFLAQWAHPARCRKL